MTFFQFSVPTKIISDWGIATDFAHECELMGITDLLLVTDPGIQKLGLAEPIVDHLNENGINVVGVFSEVPSDSSVEAVEACADQAKVSGAKGFLALGGGSVIDTAKGANILFSLGGSLKDDYAGAQTISQTLAPLIAIPTTAGTGSEVTEAIVIYDHESQSKLSFVDQHLLPTMAVLDPSLTQGLPPLLTAATAMDALTHAMEAMMSVQHGPFADALASSAIRLIKDHILKAVEDGSDQNARSALMTAATLAGVAFNHAMVGVVHAVAHSVGAVAHIHHGLANAIFLPHGLAYNRPEASERLLQIAKAWGIEGGKQQKVLDDLEREVQGLLEALHKSCDFPLSYQSAGAKAEQLERVIELACEDGAGFYNPRSLDATDLEPFVRRAFG
ncbi:MAG: iron-containing alcohol dehydrogenase [Deltaproteobacteria bacterium]|nr:iron-containing alcohol dehydrogenase [Deltaproteobacteria bacterium]